MGVSQVRLMSVKSYINAVILWNTVLYETEVVLQTLAQSPGERCWRGTAPEADSHCSLNRASYPIEDN